MSNHDVGLVLKYELICFIYSRCSEINYVFHRKAGPRLHDWKMRLKLLYRFFYPIVWHLKCISMFLLGKLAKKKKELGLFTSFRLRIEPNVPAPATFFNQECLSGLAPL